MRPFAIALVVLFLAALVAGQEVSRRERLRGLISAARGGDVEARKALRSLRDKLRRRTGEAEKPVATQPEPEIQSVVQPEPQIIEPEPPVESPVEIIEPEPVSRRQRPRERSRDLLDPHRALNRGLEVDTRSEAHAEIRVTNKTRTPPIQTLRRYSYFDEQGNYIFGYEAADGSFKEEKRGLDCIVNGKYGYVDPDGVRREYTYVSGNRCDPNAPAQEDTQGERVLNDQFLEERLSEPSPTRISEPIPARISQSSLPRIRSQVSRRRRPIQPEQPQPEFLNIPQQIREQNPVIQPEPEILPQEILPEVQPLQPEPIPETRVVVTSKPVIPQFQIKTEPVVPIFRPTPKPLTFDFDKEFKNLFSHFGITRPRAHHIPSHPKAPLPPPPPPPKLQPQPHPQPQLQPPKITAQPVKSKPAPAVSEPKPANVPHQLVFDSATGTFKTVPLTNPNFAIISVPVPKATGSKTSATSATGKPLELAGFNPLPAVPIGSLSFKGSSAVSAAQFDNFFNQFRINQ